MALKVSNRIGHAFVFVMSVAIDEKEILPGFSLAGTRFDLGHVEPVLSKRRQRGVQRADLVRNAEHDARAVLAGWRTALSPEHKEARGVRRVVLDVGFQHVKSIALRR